MRSGADARLGDACLQLLKPVSIVHRDEDGEPRQLPKQGKASLYAPLLDELQGDNKYEAQNEPLNNQPQLFP